MGEYKRFRQTLEQYVVTVKVGCETGKETHKRRKGTTTITHYATWPETFNIPKIQSKVVDIKCPVCRQTIPVRVCSIPQARKEKIHFWLWAFALSGVFAFLAISFRGDAAGAGVVAACGGLLLFLLGAYGVTNAILGNFDADEIVKISISKHKVLEFLGSSAQPARKKPERVATDEYFRNYWDSFSKPQSAQKEPGRVATPANGTDEEISENVMFYEYNKAAIPKDTGYCSDRECPCPETPIPRGSGYLYISQEAVNSMRAKMQGKVGDAGGCPMPVLTCQQGAELHGINMEVAAADAKRWWETGKVPLRPTPKAGSSVKNSTDDPLSKPRPEL